MTSKQTGSEIIQKLTVSFIEETWLDRFEI